MDTLKFIEEINRMCQSYSDCDDCPLAEKNCDLMSIFIDDEMKVTLSIVEEWSKEHQHKTRQSVFLEQWPNAKVFVDGVIDLCPQELNSHYPCQSTDYKMRCQNCRREFWMQEVK